MHQIVVRQLEVFLTGFGLLLQELDIIGRFLVGSGSDQGQQGVKILLTGALSLRSYAATDFTFRSRASAKNGAWRNSLPRNMIRFLVDRFMSLE